MAVKLSVKLAVFCENVYLHEVQEIHDFP